MNALGTAITALATLTIVGCGRGGEPSLAEVERVAKRELQADTVTCNRNRERMPGRTSRWGRGSLGHTQDEHETFHRGRRCAPAVAVDGTRTGGALAVSSWVSHKPRGASEPVKRLPACLRTSLSATTSSPPCRPRANSRSATSRSF
jgi:hypothetical protein